MSHQTRCERSTAERGRILPRLFQHFSCPGGVAGAFAAVAEALVSSFESLKHPARQQRSVHWNTRFQVEAGRNAVQFCGHLRPPGVEAHAHNKCGDLSLGADGLSQDAGELAVLKGCAKARIASDHKVVGPLQLGSDAARLLACVGCGKRDCKRHQGRTSRRQRTRWRSQQHGHHQRAARRRRPPAAAATATGGLAVRDQHDPFGCAASGPIEQFGIGGADLVVPLDIGETGAVDTAEVR